MVRHTDWGADRIVLLRLYRALVRSKPSMDRQSVLRQLDPTHHQDLRMALGALRTCPDRSLYVEAHELSLASRRPKLATAQTKISIGKSSLQKEPENFKLFEESTSKIPLLAIRKLLHLEKSKISLDLTDDASCLDITPWTLSPRTGRFALTNFKKDTTNHET